ncbi:hypothetical protein ACX8XN_06075 [Calditrichota bacterium GD2]
MGKTWLSNGILLLIFAVSLIVNSCSKSIEKNDGIKAPFFVLKNKYVIKKSSIFATSLDNIASENDSIFYFCNLFSRAIYQTKRPFKKYKIIGRNGNGPGEYITPYYVYKFHDKLYFSDITNFLIKYLYINFKNLQRKYLDYLTVSSGAKFVIDNNYIYSLNLSNPKLIIFNKNNAKRVKSLITLDEIYKLVNYKMDGGGIVKDLNGNIYLSAVAPYKVYKIQYENKDFIIKDIWDFENLPSIIKWDKDKDNNLKNLKSQYKKRKIINSFTRVSNLGLIGVKQKYLLAHLTFREEDIYHLINLNGKLIKEFKSSNFKLIYAHNNTLLFKEFNDEDIDDDYILIKEYSFNENNLE